MSAMSPGITQVQRQSSRTTKTFQHSDDAHALETFRLLIQSCYGPTGLLKSIQNSCGGQVTVTSSSSILFRRLSVSRPLLRLMLAAVDGHVDSCSDSGLFCALLMSNLAKSCKELDLHPILCINVNELMLKLCVEYLNSDDSCRMSVDVADVQTMLSLVHSVISTKPACGLSVRETDLICSLTLQVFLCSLPSSGCNLRLPSIKYVLVEGKTALDSHMVDGVLIEASQIPPYAGKQFDLLRQGDGPIRVALFNTSLAGGGEGFPDIHVETKEGITPDDASLNQLLAIGSCLVQQRIRLLACQKVVHPRLKRFLRSRGVLTVDRLSLVHIDAVQVVTGAKLLGAVQSTIPEDAFGCLEDLTHCVLYGKSYLHLQNPCHPVCSFVLCNRTESSLEELKTVCSAANHILALTLSQPLALPGAGCFEACLAAHLKQQMKVLDSDVIDDLGCSKSQFKMAASNFIHCVELVARALEHGQDSQVTDAAHHHRWPLPLGQNPSDWLRRCACGMKSFEAGSDWLPLGSRQQTGVNFSQSGELKQNGTAAQKPVLPEQETCGKLLSDQIRPQNVPVFDEKNHVVLDCFVAKLSALRVAVETANVMLRIHRTIKDNSS